MRPPLRLLLLAISLTPGAVVAQRVGTRQVMPSTDTLDTRYEQPVDDAAGPQPYTVRRIVAGSGADTGTLIEILRIERPVAGGRPGLLSLDSTVVGARDFRFRRARALRFATDGQLALDTRTELRGRTIHRWSRSGTVDSASSRTLGPGDAVPIGGEVLYLQGAPLRVGWSARVATYNGAANDYSITVFDSVRLERHGARTVWVAAILPAQYIRVHVTLDSATRAVIRLAIKGSSGDPVGSTHNRRFGAESAPASPVNGTAASPERQRPSMLDGTRVGVYYLRGEREVGSELALLPDGRFQYALAYGALDEIGAGRWSTTADGTVVLQSDGTPRSPRVTLAKAIGSATDSVLVTVHDTAGQPVNGIEVDFVQPRAGTSFRHARRGLSVLTFDPADAPTEIAVGYDVLNFMVSFPLKRPPAASYRFIFDPGDLGKRRFERESLSYVADTLFMIRNGRRLRYVRR
jgi:hypothetical protein